MILMTITTVVIIVVKMSRGPVTSTPAGVGRHITIIIIIMIRPHNIKRDAVTRTVLFMISMTVGRSAEILPRNQRGRWTWYGRVLLCRRYKRVFDKVSTRYSDVAAGYLSRGRRRNVREK